MDVERRVGGGDSLRRHFGGARGEFAQGSHVGSGEQLAFVGPTFGAVRGADAQEAALGLEDFEAVAVFDGSDDRRLERNIAANFQYRGTDEGLANGSCGRRTFGTPAEKQQQG